MTVLEWKVIVLVAAVGLDLLLGEPPNRLHPVAWMGSMIARLRRICPSDHWLTCLQWGFAITAIGALGLTVAGSLIEYASLQVRQGDTGTAWFLCVILLNAWIFKTCFGIRSLRAASGSVGEALRVGDLDEARRCLGYHLVSRDVKNLSESEVSAAAIESVAENTSDSVIAPVLFYLIAGLPGALVYRYVNTCDAMLGYRTPGLLWLGKVPARTDDLLNLIPARLTAALMMLPSLSAPGRFARALRVWWQDSGKTESPNAGHPMSAAAGLLGVRLEKADHYALGKDLRAPSREDISAMNSLFQSTVFAAVLLTVIACFALRGLHQ